MGWSLWVHAGSLDVGKANTDGFKMRNLMKSPMHGDGGVSQNDIGYGMTPRCHGNIISWSGF